MSSPRYVCELRQYDLAWLRQHVDAVMRSMRPADRCRCDAPKPVVLFSGLFRRS